MTRKASSSILQVPIGFGTLEEIIKRSMDAISQKTDSKVFACANPHSIVAAQKDKDFLRALNNADFVVADGVGVTLMGRLLGRDVGPRIAGEDYFISLLDALEKKGSGRVFFFGSSEKVLEIIKDKFGRKYPHLTLCGTLSPPYRPWSEAENNLMLKAINSANPDVLWIGMTAPKQEKWIENNRDKLNAPIVGAIGAVFDFFAETYPRAPKWMCRIGLEWLYRLIKEPRRMWKRNFISTPAFISRALWRHFIKAQ